MSIALIAAIAKNNCIGKNGALPWHIPEDMKRFKELTTGHAVLMGRKTWESIPEKFRPLPNRKNIVITRQMPYAVPPDVLVYASVEDALQDHHQDDIMVIGGAEIYRQTIAAADTLYITHIDILVEGDAFFPEIDPTMWKEVEREKKDGYTFVTYTK